MTWPPTPDVEAAVLASIDPRRPRRRLIAAVAALALLVPAGGATAWVLIDGLEIHREPPPSGVPAPPVREPVGLAEAERRAGFAALLPPGLGDPDSVTAARGLITLQYGGLRLAELRGELDGPLLQKFIGGRGVRAVRDGVFIEGRHFYVYLKPDGSIREGTTATDTLIVQRGDLLLRLEGEGLTAERALSLLGCEGC